MPLFNMSAPLPVNISLWNAHGLQDTTIHDALSYVHMSDILFVTESWYYSPMRLPVEWRQFHAYGVKVKKGYNRGQNGVCALVNPLCPFPVLELPSLNKYTLSLKVGGLRFHCLYLPPLLHNDEVFDVLESIPLLPNTFICGDLNARIGPLLGDHNSNPRGIKFLSWLQDRQLTVLNQSLSFGQPTFVGPPRIVKGKEVIPTSIIDLFVTNVDPSELLVPAITIKQDLSLCSDHKLMTLSFNIDPAIFNSDVPVPACMTPRRLWNLSRLSKPDVLLKYRSSFETLVSPVKTQLSDLVSSPPDVCPPIDELNSSLNECIYKSLDTSIGTKVSPPGHWKKYWSEEIQEASLNRDKCYSAWRHARRDMDKILRWTEYKLALKSFRQLIQKAKRKSWKLFCATLEANFSKATKTISRLKKRHATSASFSHADGTTKALEVMSSHLASVYNGSSLPADRLPAVFCSDTRPFDLPDSIFDVDDLCSVLKQLPSGKAPGPDHIKAEMLKPLGQLIGSVFKLLFQLCWQWSYTPVLWRQATVFPIHKKGDVANPANYRPISLTSVIRKLYEKVLSPLVVADSPALDVAQGGFREQRSPLDQALCLHDLMHDYFLQHHHYPSVAFLDIKSAYDTVDRRIVWRTLFNTSTFSRPLLWLLMNLFDEVSISVLLSNQSSSSFAPATGLLQGSVLSPHLYSLYINSLPAVLRQVASPKTTAVTLPESSGPTPVNCLLFADDVAILGTRQEVQAMLDLASQHSLDLGYRWNPSKCAVLNAPSPTSSSTLNFSFKLYGQVLPTVEQFTYLGMEFAKKGLHAPGIAEKRSAGAIKTMALLTSIGVNRNGFSLLFCSRLYSCFIRPKFEYGFAISKFSAPEMKVLERLQDKLVSMFLGSQQTTVAKHITCIPGVIHRYNTLVTKFVLRSGYLPEDSLLVLLQDSLQWSRLKDCLKHNELYLSLPDPPPQTDALLRKHIQQFRQDRCDAKRVQFARNGKNVLLLASRACTSKPDPILYLPMNNCARSRLVRWRLGRFTAMARSECPCQDFGALISRAHFETCRAIDPDLFLSLPAAPPGVNQLDFALNQLPTSAKSPPPAFWPDLLAILWYIDTLCHPSKQIPPDPSPGSSWYNYPR